MNPEFFRPAEADILVGDSTRAREVLGWSPEVGFDETVGMMVDAFVEPQQPSPQHPHRADLDTGPLRSAGAARSPLRSAAKARRVAMSTASLPADLRAQAPVGQVTLPTRAAESMSGSAHSWPSPTTSAA